MRRYFLLTVLSLALFVGKTKAQLTGIKTIPGNYATLALAIQDVNTQGVGAGGVIFNMLAAETAPAGGYSITASGTAANTIVFIGNNNVITASAAHTVGALNDAIFKIIGGDFISISGFTMQENVTNIVSTPTASNTMTEWGVALLYANTTNGAQNNSVLGNTISLNRTYTNTFGVYSNTRHSPTAIATTADITATTGANNGNKVWGNTISNVNMGIAFIGSNAAANQDIGNDVGGASVSTGNIITNWGGAAAASGYISNTGTSYCIFMNHQTAFNVSYNTITSAAVTPTVTFRGIVQDYTATAPTGTFSNTISNNTITMNSAQTSGTFRAIDAASGVNTMTLNIVANTILNCAISGASSSSLFGGIFNSGAVNTLNINSNIIQGGTSTATSGGFTGIQNSGAVTATVNINFNQVGNATGGAINFSAANSGAVTGITNTGGAAGSILNIQSNDFRGIVHTVAGTSTHTYITNTTGNPSTNINTNTFTNLVANTSGGVTFISNNVTHLAGTTHNVNNNSVVVGYSKPVSGGTILFYNSFSTSLTAVTEVNSGNNFSNMTFTGATTITGWRCGDGATTAPYGPGKTVTNNTFTNITGGTSSLQVLEVDYSNSNLTTNNISGNIISNITGAGAVTGIVSGQGNQNFFDNRVSGLSSTGGSLVSGILISGGAAQNISRNKFYDIMANNAAGTVNAIRVTAGTTTTIYNNLIGDLRAPVSSGTSVISGIATTGGTNTNIYFNTIHINATSTGTDFGTSGLNLSTTPTTDLRNNLVVNLSTANGTGLTVAYRRSSTALATYANTSNNNSFYAGTPSATNLIFNDGTNSDQTLAAYKTRVAPRDAASFTENPAFASLSGPSSTFLHIPAATPSFLESGGTAVASVTTTDYDVDNRPGPTGSVNGGATAPDIGADEFDGIPGCTGTPLAGTSSVAPTAVCASGTFTLTVTSASSEYGVTYQWQQSTVAGGPYSNIVGANSTTYATGSISTTMYYVCLVTCTGSGLSATTNEVVATVNALPAVVANTTATAVCDGSPVTLTGSGATSYTWTGSVTDGVAFNPATTDTYTVTGTDANGCQNTDVITVTVNPLPTVVANTTASSVCDGSPVTLTGSGATSYTWSGSVTDGVAFTPVVTDTYTVTGTDANGCQNTDVIIITVNPLPTVVANTTASTVCDGSPVTLTGSGATSYTWTGSVTDGVAFNPATTDTYTVTGTDANGCMNTDVITITVNALPFVTVSLPLDTACLNAGMVALSGESPAGGTWSGPGVTGSSFDPTVPGVGTYAMTYSYTDTNGCSASAVDSILVDVCSGLAAIINTDELNIYPNPNSGQFTIQLSAVPAQSVQVELISELGQRIDAFTMNGSVKQMDISNLEGGVYFIRITNGDKVSVHRIVKQ